MISDFISKYIALSYCLIMISGIFFFPILLDHGIFITEGWLISEGFKPYIDLFDNKPPAIYYLNSLKILLFETQLGWNFIDLLIY